MKILVTGSNGLVGSSLKKSLGKNHIYHTRRDVDLLKNEETSNYISHCINNLGVDTIIHCAAIVGGVAANSNNNERFFNENYLINNNIIDSAFQNKLPNFVNLLSTCIFPHINITYPLTPEQIDVDEPHPSNKGYALAKRLSGHQTRIIKQMTGLNWINVIPSNIYGPNDNFHLTNSHIIPGMIHRAYLSKKNNEKFVIWGDGSPLRQFTYVDDVSKLILWAIENWKNDKYFMALNDNEYSIMDVASIIIKAYNIPDNMVIFDKTKPAGQFRKPAISNVKNFEFVTIEDGINQMIKWFNKNYNTARK